MPPTGVYHGRMVTDGDGNLLADEGEFAGFPVALHEGSYVFLSAGEPSHNERYHQNYAQIDGTRTESEDPDFPVNVSDTENQHHFEVQPDDPNYGKDSIPLLPDALSAVTTGHTDAPANSGTA